MFSKVMKISAKRTFISAFAALVFVLVVSCAFPQQGAYSPEGYLSGHWGLVPGAHMPVRLDALGGEAAASGRLGIGGGVTGSRYGFISINTLTEISLSFDFHTLDATGKHMNTSSHLLYSSGQTMDINGKNIPVFRSGQQQGTENAFVLTIIRDADGEIAGWIPGIGWDTEDGESGSHWGIGWPGGGIQAFCGIEIIIICALFCAVR